MFSRVQDRTDYIILFLSAGNVIIPPIATINGVRGSFNFGIYQKRKRERERAEKVCAKSQLSYAINLPIPLKILSLFRVKESSFIYDRKLNTGRDNSGIARRTRSPVAD